MKIGDKVICKDGTQYLIVESTDDIYDFGLVDYKGINVNCVASDYLEDCLQDRKGFVVDDNRYKIPLGVQKSFMK